MRFVLILAGCLSLIACRDFSKKEEPTAAGPLQPFQPMPTATEVRDTTNLSIAQWETTDKDFGKITEGQKLEVVFRFKNIGNKPLVISSVRPSCGCTAAEPPKEPIMPGQEGEIKGSFDSNGRVGVQNKTMVVMGNFKAQESEELHFHVEVVKKNG